MPDIIVETTPFEIQTTECHFVKDHLKSRQKCLDFEWSGFRMVGFQIPMLFYNPIKKYDRRENCDSKAW